MAYLANPTSTTQILKKYQFTIQKKFGQNFLIDGNIIDKIIDAAHITKDDMVIEVGPGIGTMSQYLCERAGKVLVVEIDKKLIPILEGTLSEYSNVTILNQDILKVNLQEIIRDMNQNRPVKIVANLPYYITTPIVMGILEGDIPFSSITVMVQKEVADRMQVGPGTKDYGALSLAVQYYAKAEIIAYVPNTCFIPKPNVDSAVIRLTKLEKKPVNINNEKLMFRIIRASFNQRRKTLINSLNNSPEINFSKEDIIEAISQSEFNPNVRGEALTLEQFADLANTLDSYEKKN